MELNKIFNCDSLEYLKTLPDNSVDLFLQDLPYGVLSALQWDKKVDLSLYWNEWMRVGKDDAVFIFTATGKFAFELQSSNIDYFKYKWYWNKVNAGNFLNAKINPLNIIEEVLIFSKNLPKYYPIMTRGDDGKSRPSITRDLKGSSLVGKLTVNTNKDRNHDIRYPKNVLTFNNKSDELNSSHRLHPTQKPIKLLSYLIETYSKIGDVVYDGFMGSGSTAMACLETNRNFIGTELNHDYFTIANNRILHFENKNKKKKLF